jgi:hypothetical protein
MGEEEDDGLTGFRRHASLELRHHLALRFEAAKAPPVAARPRLHRQGPPTISRRTLLSDASHTSIGHSPVTAAGGLRYVRSVSMISVDRLVVCGRR